MFERIYHAWVLDFRDRYLRWNNPAARPWEPSCRKCDGACKTPDSLMVLCDHCDAMYGMSCKFSMEHSASFTFTYYMWLNWHPLPFSGLKPKLKKIPTGVWHCPSCAPKVKKNLSVSILSAVSEQAARKRAEIGDAPKKKVVSMTMTPTWRLVPRTLTRNLKLYLNT